MKKLLSMILVVAMVMSCVFVVPVSAEGTITISSVEDGDIFAAGSIVPLAVTAELAEVSHVDFYANGEKIPGSLVGTSGTLYWTVKHAGTYYLTANAVGNTGDIAATTAGAVEITVKGRGGEGELTAETNVPDEATNVCNALSEYKITFSNPLANGAAAAVSLWDETEDAVEYEEVIAGVDFVKIVSPVLEFDTTYTVKVEGISDIYGNVLTKEYTFTTIAANCDAATPYPEIVYPATGTKAATGTQIAVKVASSLNVARVEISEDGTVLGYAMPKTGNEFQLNTTDLEAGEHTITARAYNKAGEAIGAAVESTFTLVNPGEYTVEGIKDNDSYYLIPSLGKKVVVSSDLGDIEKVEFDAGDGEPIVVESYPYEWSAPTNATYAGEHTLTISVHDIYGKVSTGTYNYTAEYVKNLWKTGEDFESMRDGDSVAITFDKHVELYQGGTATVVNDQTLLEGNAVKIVVPEGNKRMTIFIPNTMIESSTLQSLKSNVEFFVFEFDAVRNSIYGSLTPAFGFPGTGYSRYRTSASIYTGNDGNEMTDFNKLDTKLHYGLVLDTVDKTYTIYENGVVIKGPEAWNDDTKGAYSYNNHLSVGLDLNFYAANTSFLWLDNISYTAYKKSELALGTYSASGIANGETFSFSEGSGKTVTVESTQADISKVEFVLDDGEPTYDETAPYEWTTPTNPGHMGAHTLDIYVHNIYGERVPVGTTYNYTAELVKAVWTINETFEGKKDGDAVTLTNAGSAVSTVSSSQTLLDGNSAQVVINKGNSSQTILFTDYSMIDEKTMSSIIDKVDFYEFEFDLVKSYRYGSVIISFGAPESGYTNYTVFENDNPNSTKLNKKLHYKLVIDAEAKTYTLYENGAVLKEPTAWEQRTKDKYTGTNSFGVGFGLNFGATQTPYHWFDNISFAAYQKGVEVGEYSASGITDGFEYYTVASDAQTVTVTSTQSDISKVEFVVDGVSTFVEAAPYQWTTPTTPDHSGRHTLEIYVHNMYDQRVKVGETYNYIAKYVTAHEYNFADFEDKNDGETIAITNGTSNTATAAVATQAGLGGKAVGIAFGSSAAHTVFFNDITKIDGPTMNSLRSKIDFFECEFDLYKTDRYGAVSVTFGVPTYDAGCTTIATDFVNVNDGSSKLNKKLHYRLVVDARAKTYTLYEEGAVLKSGDWTADTKTNYWGENAFGIGVKINWASGGNSQGHFFDNISFGAYQKGKADGSLDAWWNEATLAEGIEATKFANSVKVYNETNAAKKLMNIYAEYTPEGVLVNAAVNEVTVPAGETIEREYSLSDLTVGNTIKFFTWDADTYKPYTIPTKE